MPDCPPDLRRAYREGRLIPFVGAGATVSVNWDQGGETRRGPSWKELVDRAALLLGFEEPDLARARGTDLQILEYFRSEHGGEAAMLTNWLSQNLRPPDEALRDSPIHRELAALDLCREIYTTNYDDFIERAFSLHGRQFRRVAVEEQMGSKRRGCEIVKFHGDLDHPSQIVLSESDYEKRLSLQTAMDLRLRGDLLGRVLLFVGYSFRDPNVSYLFRLFTDHFHEKAGAYRGRRGYIAVAKPSRFEYRLFEQRSIEVIALEGKDQTEETADLLKQLRS